MLTAAFAVLGAVFVSVSAFTPTAGQKIDAQLGTYQQRASATLTVGTIPAGTLERSRSALATAVPTAHAWFQTDRLRPDALPKTYYQGGIDTVATIEDPDLQGGFPGRYRLDHGRWPAAADEVVVSRRLRDDLPTGDTFMTMSGRVRMRVVGTMTDDYRRHQYVAVVGPGTLAGLTPRPPAQRYQVADVQLEVLWGEQRSAADVARALTPVLPPPPPGQASAGTAIVDSSAHRPREFADPPRPIFGGDRFVVSYLPLALVALLVAAFVVVATRTAQRTDEERLVALGVRRSTTTITRVAAASVTCSLSIAGGLALGWSLAVASRPTVLDRLADGPLSPVPLPSFALLAIAAGTLVLVVVGTGWPRRTVGAAGTPSGVPVRWLAEIHLPLVRRVLAALLIITALSSSAGPYSVLAAYLAVAAVLLFAPDVLALLVRALPRARPRAFVTRALMTADRRRQGIAVVVVGACIAVPVCGGAQLASRQASDATYSYARVPPGQVWLEATNGVQDIDALARAVSAVPGTGDPVVVHSSIFSADPTVERSTQVGLTTTPQGNGSFNSSLMTLESAQDLNRLLGDALPSGAEKILAGGGVVDFNGIPGQQSLTMQTIGEPDVTSAPLPTAHLRLDKTWHGRYAGAVLLSTTEKLGMPMNAPKRYYYTGVSLQVAQDAAAAAIKAGYDSDFVQYRTPPPPPDIPAAAWVFLAALALGAFGVLLLVVGGQAARLRAYAARLIAIGLTPGWTRGILALQAGLTVGVGLVGGVVAGLVGVQVIAGHYATTVVPAAVITVASVATVIAAGAATALGARRLNATEQPEVT